MKIGYALVIFDDEDTPIVNHELEYFLPHKNNPSIFFVPSILEEYTNDTPQKIAGYIAQMVEAASSKDA